MNISIIFLVGHIFVFLLVGPLLINLKDGEDLLLFFTVYPAYTAFYLILQNPNDKSAYGTMLLISFIAGGFLFFVRAVRKVIANDRN